MKLFFDMEIVDETGQVHGRLRREIHEDAAYMGPMVVNEMRLGLSPSSENAVRVMQVREFRNY